MSNKINPGRLHVAVTPHDTNYLPAGVNCIYCTADGNCVVEDAAGTQITYAMVAGQLLPFEAKRIRAASTGTYVAWRV